ncbi:polymerase [Pseudomonas sp. MS19]|uniref:polymerase n=1 Tax=Pseudomonas sp. MS19 TaxID=2579939 RepID=UPI001561D48D|nr:polymerase [Pseudomonas sp. MS19]NRH27895.1 polymerase [Pseudomonas sp. MS19]
MTTLTQAQLKAKLEGSQTIEEDGYGLKVARLADGSFLKLFRRKRLLSSSLWAPPSVRFARNAARLIALGIPAPITLDLIVVPELQLNGLQYEPVAGETLRSYWRTLTQEQLPNELFRFGNFLGQLHESGVYFRSLHLGNVLIMPDQQFALIDVSDMKIFSRPLSFWQRTRNVQHMVRYKEDTTWLADEHLDSLVQGYAQSAGNKAAARLNHAFTSRKQAAK